MTTQLLEKIELGNTLEFTDNTLNVVKSSDENNQLEIRENGLYVPASTGTSTTTSEMLGVNSLLANSTQYKEITSQMNSEESIGLSDNLSYAGVKFRYFFDNTTGELIARPVPKNLVLNAKNITEIFSNLREEAVTDEFLTTSFGVNYDQISRIFDSYWTDYTKDDFKKVTLDYVVTGQFTKEDYNTFIGLVDTSQVLNPYEEGRYGLSNNYKLGSLIAKKLGISYRNSDSDVRDASLKNINFLTTHNNKSNYTYYGELLIGYNNPQYSVQDIDDNTVEFRFVIPNILMLVLNQKFATVTLDYTNATVPQSDSANYVSDSRYTESLNTGSAIDLSNMPEPTVGEFTFDNGKVVFENPNANKIVIGKSNTATVV